MRLYKPKYSDGKGGKRESAVWWAQYYVEGRRFRKSMKTRDRKAAEIKAANAMKVEVLRAAGVETHADTRDLPTESLVAEYEGELARRGRAPRYVRQVGGQLRRFLKGSPTLSKVTPARIRAHLRSLTEGGSTPQTANRHRVALLAFFGWLVRDGRWASNPVDTIPAAKSGDPTFVRRALDKEEFARFLSKTPPDRLTAYLFAARTGMRRGELEGLRWNCVDLRGGTVVARASLSKNGKEAVLPLSPEVVQALSNLPRSGGSNALVFETVPSVATLRADLKVAGLEYENDSGRLDFHALRTCFGTALGRAGVSLVQTQRLMRHSTPTLTANVYTRLELHDAHAAVGKLDGSGTLSATVSIPSPAAARRCTSSPLGSDESSAAPSGDAGGSRRRKPQVRGLEKGGGEGVIRTREGIASRFTVCPR